jgi:hypothetical protein
MAVWVQVKDETVEHHKHICDQIPPPQKKTNIVVIRLELKRRSLL